MGILCTYKTLVAHVKAVAEFGLAAAFRARTFERKNMNTKRHRNKLRRRASKLAEQAWAAAENENCQLAVKLIRRAVELNPTSPVLWNDQGTLLLQLNQVEEAAASFQAAIHAAHDFAEPFANLAGIRAREGMLEQAVALQREAVRHTPESDLMRNTLAAYEALLAGGCGLAPSDSEL